MLLASRVALTYGTDTSTSIFGDLLVLPVRSWVNVHMYISHNIRTVQHGASHPKMKVGQVVV